VATAARPAAAPRRGPSTVRATSRSETLPPPVPTRRPGETTPVPRPRRKPSRHPAGIIAAGPGAPSRPPRTRWRPGATQSPASRNTSSSELRMLAVHRRWRSGQVPGHPPDSRFSGRDGHHRSRTTTKFGTGTSSPTTAVRPPGLAGVPPHRLQARAGQGRRRECRPGIARAGPSLGDGAHRTVPKERPANASMTLPSTPAQGPGLQRLQAGYTRPPKHHDRPADHAASRAAAGLDRLGPGTGSMIPGGAGSRFLRHRRAAPDRRAWARPAGHSERRRFGGDRPRR